MHPTKKRWQLAEEIGDKMGVSKGEGFTLIPILTQNGLLEKVLNNDSEAIQAAGKLQWFGKTNVALDNKANGISIMVWAIRKCGSVEVARDAFEKAASLLSEKS